MDLKAPQHNNMKTHMHPILVHMGPWSFWAISTSHWPCPHLLALFRHCTWSFTCVMRVVGGETKE
jgi:hypothetical protein